MRASEGIGFLYRSRVGKTSTAAEGRLRHTVSFLFVQSKLLKHFSTRHLNSKEETKPSSGCLPESLWWTWPSRPTSKINSRNLRSPFALKRDTKS